MFVCIVVIVEVVDDAVLTAGELGVVVVHPGKIATVVGGVAVLF